MSEAETAPLLLTALRDLAARIVGTADVEDRNTILRAADEIEQSRAAREEAPTHFEWAERYETGETQTTACEIPLDGRDHTSYRKEVTCVACLQTMLAAAREDTERPDHKRVERLREVLETIEGEARCAGDYETNETRERALASIEETARNTLRIIAEEWHFGARQDTQG